MLEFYLGIGVIFLLHQPKFDDLGFIDQQPLYFATTTATQNNRFDRALIGCFIFHCI